MGRTAVGSPAIWFRAGDVLFGGSMVKKAKTVGRVRPGQQYPEDVKRAAVKALEEGRTFKEVMQIFQVKAGTLRKWRERLSKDWEKGAARRWQRVTQERKLAMVQQVLKGRSVPAVARENDVTDSVLYRWVDKYAGDKEPLARKIDLGAIMDRMRTTDEEKERAKAERLQSATQEQSKISEMVADPLLWMQHYTETKDSHWQENGAESAYRPFPEKPYFRPVIEHLQQEPVVFIEKSRNMMLSWLCVGFFTHAAMTTPGIEVLFQSQKEEKAFELVDYAKTLYDRQQQELKRAFPLTKNLKDMADGELNFANGSRIVGIPGGADQIRSNHPWGLLMDEAAFMPEAGDCYNNAVPVCKKMVVLSSAGPGWFGEVCAGGAVVSN